MPAFRGPDGRVVYVPEEQAERYRVGSEYQEVGNETAGSLANQIAPTHTGVAGTLGAVATSALSGATLGASDFALKGLLDTQDFEQVAQDRRDNPILSGVGQVAGAIAPMLLTGGAATPAGALGRLAAGASEGAGVAGRLAIAGTEGALQNAGIYLSDVALGDRKLTAEGMNGALGTGLLFGAAGVPIAHGIEAGTIAARRMFARYAEGGAEAADAAAAAWTEKAQRHLEGFDQAAELAKARLAETQTAREAANLQRLRAGAEAADARAFTPSSEFPGGSAGSEAVPSGSGTSAAGPAGDAGGAGAAAVAPAEPPEVSMARALRDRAKVLGGEPITPGEAPLGSPGFRRTYVIPGERSPPALNALEQLAQEPGVVTHGPVPVTADEAELGARLGEYQAARRAFDEAHAQVDPAFAAAMRKIDAGQPALDRMLAGADQSDLETMLGTMRGGAPGNPQLEGAMRRLVDTPDVVGAGGIPVGEFGAPGAGGFKSQDELARLASGTDAEAAAREVRDLTAGRAARAEEGTAVLAKGTQPRSLGQVAAEQSPVPIEQAPKVPAGFDVHGATEAGPVFDKNPSVQNGAPTFADLDRETYRQRAYVVRPSELEGPTLRGITSGDDMVAGARTAKVRDAWGKGESVPALEIDVDPKGHYFVADGNHRLLAAAADGDRPILARFRPVEAEVGNMDRIGDDLSRALGRGGELPKMNPKRVEAAKKAGAASVERRREIHSAVASNLPQELQLSWDKEGYKFMQEEAPRIRGKKDPISAASDISEAFTEKYGSASETGRGYEGDRYHRRLDIEAQHAESWAKEQGRKHNKEAVREEAHRVRDQSDQLSLLAERSSRSLDDVTELFHERAAIHEFEGGKPRAEAERLALDDVANAMRGTSEHAATDTLTGQLRGMQAKLGAGEDLVAMGEPAREAYRAAKAERTTAAAEHFRGEALAARGERAARHGLGDPSAPWNEGIPMAKAHGTYDAPDPSFFAKLTAPKTRDAYVAANIGRAMREEGSHAAGLARLEREWAESSGHPFEIKRLEMAHDDALERAATAADPAERSAAAQEAQAIEKQITQVGARPGAVEDIAALAPAVTRIEKAAAALTEALGDAAPAAAKEHAAAFRAAEDEASRKTVARIGQAVDDAATGRAAAQSRDPLAPPATAAEDLLLGPSQKQQRIAAAQKAQREAGAAYAKARVAEAEARIGAKQAAGAAADARAKLGPPPDATGAAPRGRGIAGRAVHAAHVAGYAAELGSDLGIPGIPHPHDIPVIGPLLSAYLKYRALRAAAGRFMGRVPATAETRAAALAARTRDGIARSVDRSLGLLERNANTVRSALTVGTLKATDALSKRLVDDGAPDAPAKASVSEQAAVRMREVAAVIVNPSLVHDAIRAQGRALTDPDLIDALSAHLLTMFQRLSDVAPKGPPPNPFTGKQWAPSPAEAIRFGQQVAIARDPQVAFQMLEAGTLTPAGADTLRACYQLLFRDGQARVIQRATDLKHPVDYSQLIRLGRLFDLPLHPSQDPEHAAVLAGAHTLAAKPAPSPNSPPTPSTAGPTTLSNLYQPSGERAQR